MKKLFTIIVIFLTSCTTTSVSHNKPHSNGPKPLIWDKKTEEGILYTIITEIDYHRVTAMIDYYNKDLEVQTVHTLIQWHNVKAKVFYTFLDTTLESNENLHTYTYELRLWATNEEWEVYTNQN